MWGVSLAPRARMASRYSTPRLLLGWPRQSAALPRRVVAAAWRAAGKESPLSSARRSSVFQAGLWRQWATCWRGAKSPVSLPKLRMSTTPVAASRPTPPRAKGSAEAAAQRVGSSSTRSTPWARASAARVHLSARAGWPRWTQFPLMAQTMALSAPKARRTVWMWWRWPL